MHWLDRISLTILLIVAVPLALAPWPMKPRVHLWEKIQMLAAGELTASVDIFDLVLHGMPVVLVVLKLVRMATHRKNA